MADRDVADRDVVADRLLIDLYVAKRMAERARRALARAERVVELRQRELDAYERDGSVPRRKSVRDEIADARVRQAYSAGMVQRKRGEA